MIEDLDKLISSYSGGIKDFEQIEEILSNFMNVVASSVIYQKTNSSKGPIRTIVNCCGLDDSSYDKLTFSEIISLLYNAELFKEFLTENEDGSFDKYMFPRFISFCIINSLIRTNRSKQEVSQLFDINFYKYSQFMTREISKTNIRESAQICGQLMKVLTEINNGDTPENDATLGDIFDMLHQKYFKPWQPGVESPDAYIKGVLDICHASWIMLVIYPYMAFKLEETTKVVQVVKKYAEQ